MRHHDVFLGRESLPPDLSDHDIATYFTCTQEEIEYLKNNHYTKGRFAGALQLGFLRFTGARIDKFHQVPRKLLDHIGEQFGEKPPHVAALRGFFKAKNSRNVQFAWVIEHLGWRRPTAADDRELTEYLRGLAPGVPTRDALAGFARRYMYEQKLVLPSPRALLERCGRIHSECEEGLFEEICRIVPEEKRNAWFDALLKKHGVGRMTNLEWLQAPLKKRSPSTMAEQMRKIEFMKELGVDQYTLSIVPYERQLDYYRRLRARRPSKVKELNQRSQMLEVVCFLSCCLRKGTDVSLNMISWATTDLFKKSRQTVTVRQAARAADFRSAMARINSLTNTESTTLDQAETVRKAIQEIIGPLLNESAKSKSELVRELSLDQARQTKKLVNQVVELNVEAEQGTYADSALQFLKDASLRKRKALDPDEKVRCRDKWDNLVNQGDDHAKRLKAAILAALAEFSRGVRRGDLWVSHSETYRYKKDHLISDPVWKAQKKRHFAAFNLPDSAREFLQRHLTELERGLAAMSMGLEAGDFCIASDRLHIPKIDPETDPPGHVEASNFLDATIGEIQLPELLLKVDAETHFSRALLGGRAPYDANELLTLYGGMLANGSDMTAKNIAMMTPGLSAERIATAMKSIQDPALLHSANKLVVEFMLKFPVTKCWGPGNWASADAISLETTRHLYSARLEPRKRVPATGMYTHILDQYAMVYDQPILINSRQVGHAIEGFLRQNSAELDRLSVDTHGYTHFGMGLAKLLKFDLFPRLKGLDKLRLIVPTGTEVPEALLPVTEFISIRAIKKQSNYESLVHLAASIADGTVSAPVALHRFGHASKGDPVYEAGQQLGKLLRTIFLCDYYTKPGFRRELHRVLNRGESVHTLNRAIHSGRIPHHKARTDDELVAVSGCLRLLSNIVMAWSTASTQAAIEQLEEQGIRLGEPVLKHIGPIRFKAVNFRGMFNFPIEQYAAHIIGAPSRNRSGKLRDRVQQRH